MPFSYEVDTNARVAYVRSWGPLDIGESLTAPVQLSEHPDYEPDFGVVVDLSDVLYQPRAQDVVAVARHLIRLREHFQYRVGIVVPKEMSMGAELGAAIANAGGFPLRVFIDLDAALFWVRPGLPPESGVEDPD